MPGLVFVTAMSVGVNFFMGWYLIQAAARRRGYELIEITSYLGTLYKPYQYLYATMSERLEESAGLSRLILNLGFFLLASMTILVIDIHNILVASQPAGQDKSHLILGFIVRFVVFVIFLCSPIQGHKENPQSRPL